MLFTSVPFLLYFLPATLIGYQLISRYGRRAILGWLAFMSVVFYSYWDYRFVPVLLGSVLVNYLLSRTIARASEGARKIWLVLGISTNLLALCFFKYLSPSLDFFSRAYSDQHFWTHIALPLGISFFTFTQIAYLVDLSQGLAEPQGFVEYTLFVTFFPHLIAGPILHHKEMMPQFSKERSYRLNPDDLLAGLSWFILGLAKKAILADHLASVVDPLFRRIPALTPGSAWIAVLSYSLQLYFDFSGYSDMAIGLARMFSIDFPFNFNSPYKAANIIDFWARWHMTLTRYITLYLYNPISMAISRRRMAAGKKVSRAAQKTFAGFTGMVAAPLLITMFLAGIWHGAGRQFIIFGVLHGCYLVVNHAWRIFVRPPAAASSSRIAHVASVLLTFVCVLVAQVFFRANSVGDALQMLATMIGLHHGAMPPRIDANVFLIVAAVPVIWFMPNTQEIMRQVQSSWARKYDVQFFFYRADWTWSCAMAALFLVTILFISNGATFLYFQF